MTEPPERTTSVFAIGERSFTIEDVIAAAYFRGDLKKWWERALYLDECETRAADLGEGDADEEAVQAASEQFRYDRDLITAEETEAWLETRGLTEDDFSDHFARHYWAGQLEGKVEPVPVEYLSAPEALRDLLRVELLLSGGFDRLAFTLSCSCAALHQAPEKVTPELVEAERAEFIERMGLEAGASTGAGAGPVAAWLAKMQRDEPWLEEMLALQAAYRLQTSEVLTPGQRERTLHAMRMPLTRVELETIELESIDAAHEVMLCVREDGMSVAEVAAEGRYPYRLDERMIGDFVPELQQKLLCAVPGDLLDPIDQGDGFCLYRLSRKIEPALDDALIRARVEREILTRHFTELAANHVRWQPGFSPPPP